MKQRVIVKRNEGVLYDGKLINIPIKESFIVDKSIELFDDEDPCIIHKSYIAKEYASIILGLATDSPIIHVKDYADTLAFLDFEKVHDISIELKG